MLSTIVFCEERVIAHSGRNVAEVLARTLASLVTAKIEGVLCDVCIAGPAGQEIHVLANHAGCSLAEAEQERDWLWIALQAARRQDVFLLRCGFAPEAGFIEEAQGLLKANAKVSQAASLRSAPCGFLERVFPSLSPVAGLIASRDDLLRASPCGFQKLARRIAPVTILRTHARQIF
jgi:hypothetical protein